ncbi:conserved hypothetical protein [Sporisorium reilianum SRZ2]|uniref:Protein transport protein BOS1 n=1 Tax=Sporisorium reilianum (strain SRZ2) TaxID=999809 RepID=E6ZUN6_SPORE|nr:conserved hypothetical protein [Sporisorium reilianum SRZ2]
MNSLYNQALRQFSSIQSDISRIDSEGDAASSTAFGPVTVSLSSLERTIDEYENLAKKELIQSKQEKALTRVSKFRTDYAELQSQLARLKAKGALSNGVNGSSTASSSATLRSPTNAGFGQNANRRVSAIAESPFSLHARNSAPQADPLAAYKMNASAAAMFGGEGGFSARESHALREHSFIQQTEAQLDAFIAQGREVFGNLVEQRGILKGTQRRLRDAANTLGLSRDVIGYIERRSTQDNIIFAVGALFTLVCFWYIYKWFG